MTFFTGIKKIVAPFRFKVIKKYNTQKNITLLDVGCGNNSYLLSKKWLPLGAYHGIDKEFWHGNEADYKAMDKVFFIDVENDLNKLSEVENDTYEVIIVAYIIEHIINAYEVLEALIPKLKKGGLIYVEAPNPKTLGMPPAVGFANFNDDPTHVQIYDYFSISHMFLKKGMKIERAGTRRDWFRIFFFTQIGILMNLFYYIPFKQKLSAIGLWDFLGISFYVIARKK